MDKHLLLAFNLDEQRYALSLSAVQQVTRVVAITPLPKAPEIVLGVINARGKILPVLDIRKRFGLPKPNHIDLSDQLIIAHTGARGVALVVDSIIGVLEFSAEEMVDAESIAPGLKHVQAITSFAGDVLLVHNLDRFLSLEEESRLHDLLDSSGGHA
jgi:purine-binding chemotaxis protein CheW